MFSRSGGLVTENTMLRLKVTYSIGKSQRSVAVVCIEALKHMRHLCFLVLTSVRLIVYEVEMVQGVS